MSVSWGNPEWTIAPGANTSASWATPCNCPVCRMSRAMKALESAHDDLIEQGEGESVDLFYLRDEVEAVLADRWWNRPWRQHRHLRKALEATGQDRRPHRRDRL